MNRTITVGVTCANCAIQYGMEIPFAPVLTVWEQIVLSIPRCGACGDEDITIAIRVKDVKS